MAIKSIIGPTDGPRRIVRPTLLPGPSCRGTYRNPTSQAHLTKTLTCGIHCYRYWEYPKTR